jgi:hypothetical protein
LFGGKCFCSFTNYKENAQKPEAYSKYTGHVSDWYRMNRTDTGNLPDEHRIKRIYNGKILDEHRMKRTINVNVPYVNMLALKGRELQNCTENLHLKHVVDLLLITSSLPFKGLRMKSSQLISTVAHAVMIYHLLV